MGEMLPDIFKLGHYRPSDRAVRQRTVRIRGRQESVVFVGTPVRQHLFRGGQVEKNDPHAQRQ